MKNKPFRILTYTFANVWMVLTLVPLVTTILSSLKSNADIFGGSLLLPTEWIFSNYSDAVIDANILKSVLNSPTAGDNR